MGSLAIAGLGAAGLTHAWRAHREMVAASPARAKEDDEGDTHPGSDLLGRTKSALHLPTLPRLEPAAKTSDDPRPDPFAGPREPANLGSQSEMERYIDRQSATQSRQQSAEGARRKVQVTLYATRANAACDQARDWLQRNEVTYFERDIEADPAAKRKMALLNDRGSVPTFDIEGGVVIGFDEAAIKAAITRASAHHLGRGPI